MDYLETPSPTIVKTEDFLVEILKPCTSQTMLTYYVNCERSSLTSCEATNSDCVWELYAAISVEWQCSTSCSYCNGGTPQPPLDSAEAWKTYMNRLKNTVAEIGNYNQDTSVYLLLITQLTCQQLRDYIINSCAECFSDANFLFGHVNILSSSATDCESEGILANSTNIAIAPIDKLGDYVDRFTVCTGASDPTLRPGIPDKPSKRLMILLMATTIPCGCVLAVAVAIVVRRFCRKRRQRTRIPRPVCSQVFVTSRSQVKASNISIPHEIVDESTANQKRDMWELDREDLIVQKDFVLGKGTFAVVYKGFLDSHIPRMFQIRNLNLALHNDPSTQFAVAVKVLREDVDEAARLDFMNEIAFLKDLGGHPHVLSLIGCITTDQFPIIVTEHCGKGDLLKFLRSKKQEKTVTESPQLLDEPPSSNTKLLTLISWQIADGMNFISSKHLIHRDLAARNILLTEQMSVKISDFGLCRGAASNPRYRNEGLFPFKWMAPESLLRREFTAETDVWSYGVVLFEIFSLGEVPYEDVVSARMADHLKEGNRLAQPVGCPDQVYVVMKSCWQENPDRRPRFAQLKAELESMLSNTNDGYAYLALG